MNTAQAITRKAINPLQRKNVNRALSVAYEKFAQKYPQWAQYLFDDYFVESRVSPLLANGSTPGITTIVNAWADQIAWTHQDARQRATRELEPAARHFLALVFLEAELA